MATLHGLGFLATLVVASLTVACRSEPAKPRHVASCATPRPDQPPLVALWDAGQRMRFANEPARPDDGILFAAFADCTVVFRRGESLQVGRVPADRIDEMLAAIRAAGFFAPPLEQGVLYPDGSKQTLTVRDPPFERTLSHHGPTDQWLRDDIARTGPTASPSREKMQAFAEMWDKILATLAAVRPAEAAPYPHDRELPTPAR